MKKIIGFSLLHLFVDFFSIYILFCYADTINNFVIWVFIYNVLAFFTQPVVGAILDKNKFGLEIALISAFLLGITSMIPVYYISIPLGALLNSVFHVAAGNEVMEHTKKSWPLGVFISFGSIGLGLGYTFANNIILYISLLVVYFFIIILTYSYREEEYLIDFDREFVSKKLNLNNLVLPIILILLAVGLRGFFGQYNDNASLGQYSFLLISIVVFAGKFIGGFIFDYAKGSILFMCSLIFSVLGIIFRTNSYLMLLGVFGTNILMAFTLDGMRRVMPKHKAFGFGMIASVLLFGTLIGSYVIQNFEYLSFLGYSLSLVNILISICVYILIKKERKYLYDL